MTIQSNTDYKYLQGLAQFEEPKYGSEKVKAL
jgi:hypothetical protein